MKMDADIKSPPPLTFDKVMEGRVVAARDNPLFKVPTEILNIIASYILTNNDDLASLAMVNSDFRQLARSCQFSTVTFDGSPRSENILGILQREAVERRQNHGHRCSLSMGVCVRRVVVDSASYWKLLRASMQGERSRFTDDTSGDESEDDLDRHQQWRATEDKLGHRHDTTYLPNVLLVISTLVHLESVHLSQTHWNQTLLNNLTASTIRHLLLRDLHMGDAIPVMNSAVVWPLETLDIILTWNVDHIGSRLDVSDCWNNILRLSSGSLKVLYLSHDNVHDEKDPISFSLQFPHLRRLDLTYESNFDQSALRSLIFTSPGCQLFH